MERIQDTGGLTIGFSLRPGWQDAVIQGDLLPVLRNMGFHLVETPLPMVGAYDLHTAREITKNGISVSFHATGDSWGLYGDHDYLRDAQKRLTEASCLANDTGRPVVINVHPSESFASRTENLAITTDGLRALASIIEGDGLSLFLSLENLPYDPWSDTRFGNDPNEILSVVQQVNSPVVGVTWDTAHYDSSIRNRIVSGNLGVDFFKYLFHVHLSDFSPGYGDHLPLGCGDSSYCDYLAELERADFDSAVVLEIGYEKASTFGEPLELLEESFKRTVDCLSAERLAS